MRKALSTLMTLLFFGGSGAFLSAQEMGQVESYANGQIRGSWHFNKFTDDETGTYGHKTVNSAYDPKHNLVYVLTDARNVTVASLEDSASLEITNPQIVINGNLFLGVPSKKDKFYLIGAIQPRWNEGSIYYSDNGGQSWNKSKNGDLIDQEVVWSDILDDRDHTVLVMTQQSIGKARASLTIYRLIKSVDQGRSFTEVLSWEEDQASEVLACKPYNQNTVFLLRKITNSNLLYTETINLTKALREKISVHYTLLAPGSLVGTFHQDTTWLYMGAKDGGLVSHDAGQTWESVKLRQNLAAVHPDDPELVIEHSANTWFSKDGGKIWERLPWWEPVFGWDMQGFRWYRTPDNTWMAILNNDFGAHFTTNFQDSASWKHLNTDNFHMLIHHGAYEESTDLLVTGNQDRGTMHWQKVKEGYYQGSTATKADGLRVCIANQGMSYWYIHYWNTMYHRNFRPGQQEKLDSLVVSIGGALKDTTWYTPPMAPSWKPGEDAIFLAGNGRLIKLTYDSYYMSISRMELPFAFRDSTHEVLSGLATTRADENRMYAASRNGKFYFSNNLGKDWESTSYTGSVPYIKNRPWWGPYGYAIVTPPDNPDKVFWAGEGDLSAAFLVSEDGGKTFHASTDGLPEWNNIRSMAATPGGEYVFANNGYVWVQNDQRWYDMSGGSCPKGAAITAVEYLPKQRIVRYFTYGSGVVDFRLEF